jgi:hypothetical protein
MAWEILVLAEYNVLSMSNQTIDLGSLARVRVRDAIQNSNRPSSGIFGDIDQWGYVVYGMTRIAVSCERAYLVEGTITNIEFRSHAVNSDATRLCTRNIDRRTPQQTVSSRLTL